MPKPDEPDKPDDRWTSYGPLTLPCGVTTEVKQLKGELTWKAFVISALDLSGTSRADAERRLAQLLRRAAAELEVRWPEPR